MKLGYLRAMASLGAGAAAPLGACGAPAVAPETSPAPAPNVASEDVSDQASSPPPASHPKEPAMSAAISPTGEPHPGEILHDDKVDGRSWTVKASDVPPTIGWVQVGGTWHAVVRIEISGTREQRRFTKFGRDGAWLESTVQAPPPPPRAPEPEPTPTPSDPD